MGSEAKGTDLLEGGSGGEGREGRVRVSPRVTQAAESLVEAARLIEPREGAASDVTETECIRALSPSSTREGLNSLPRSWLTRGRDFRRPIGDAPK
jgi:hypothetical protein